MSYGNEVCFAINRPVILRSDGATKSIEACPTQCCGCRHWSEAGSACNALDGQMPGRTTLAIAIELVLGVLAKEGKCPLVLVG